MSLIVAPQSPLLVLPGAAPFVGPLDALPVTTAAYSLRRLLAAYTANKAINIRATGDNATTDIGFTSAGDLDTTTLNAFLVTHGGSAAVTKWYDQSGNGHDLVQATAASQPVITLNAANGHPTITCSSSVMSTAASVVQAQPLTVVSVVQVTNITSQNIFIQDFTRAINILSDATSKLFSNDASGPAFSTSTRHVAVGVFNGASSSLIVDQGTPTNYTDTNDFLNGVVTVFEDRTSGTLNLIGDMAELVTYSSALSGSNLTTAQSNPKSYYGTP